MKNKIVVCDDEQDILDITQMILEDEGYDVIPVIDSTKVETIIQAEQPKLLLIDLWMPGLSGSQVVNSLRTNQAYKSLPVIVISASQDGRQVAFASGADDFLEKPYDINSLLKLVRQRI